MIIQILQRIAEAAIKKVKTKVGIIGCVSGIDRIDDLQEFACGYDDTLFLCPSLASVVHVGQSKLAVVTDGAFGRVCAARDN